MKQSIKICSLLVWSLLLSISAFPQSSSNKLGGIRKNLEGKNLSVRWEKMSTEKALSLLQDNGSFADGKPDKKQIIGRIMQWAIDYHKGAYSNKKELRTSIYKALQYWLDNKPKYRFPSIPFETLRALAAIELVIYDDMMKDRQLSAPKEKQIDKLLQSITEFSHWCWYNGKDPSVFDKERGHNRGGNVGYRLWAMTAIASCSGDVKELDWVHQIVKEQFPRVLNTTSDLPTGFTPDGSWIQHNAGGAQNYWIGYGVHWIKHVLSYAKATNDSQWELTSEEWNTLADYYLEGIQWYYYKNHGALNIAGRHNALTQAPLDKGAIRKDVLRLLKDGHLNAVKTKELKALLKRHQNKQFAHIDSTKYFWNTDLLIHSTPQAYFAIKMLSNRSTGCETSESERAHGKNNFLSGDGSSIIYNTGKEYDKARIGWNWRAWPGITAIQKEGKLPLSPWGKESISLNQFAGGLSTGKQGLAAFQYNRKNSYVNLKANKAYFTFDNKMLALGNSINKNEAGPFDVWTTLNQTERKGDILYQINGKKGKIKAGKTRNIASKKITKPSWVYHNSTAYVILPSNTASKIKLFAEKRTGNWSDLDGRYTNKKNQIESTSIFQLSLSHGSSPIHADYAYMVIPGIDIKTLQNCVQNDLPEIIQNNKTAQAIRYNLNSYMIIFYKAGNVQLTNHIKLATNQPAIIHLNKSKGEWQATVSDPLQNQDKTEIELSEKDKTKSFTINFPAGINRGKSIESTLEL
ncbi:polysaccharide lyase beta-sandwich domain-containing protein [Ancylomarina sp. DW003]|nr:polysaccharide lyase family 8 super-sandwich domain-containing protein [Ancylomarina sp. DW003]MDE5421261.1 polysaccharide lyase beta-sandwich domain-containing protein [Ancylomarina sp. DW003]